MRGHINEQSIPFTFNVNITTINTHIFIDFLRKSRKYYASINTPFNSVLYIYLKHFSATNPVSNFYATKCMTAFARFLVHT